jgi:tetratricopeptide (TPR) repeat protein
MRLSNILGFLLLLSLLLNGCKLPWMFTLWALAALPLIILLIHRPVRISFFVLAVSGLLTLNLFFSADQWAGLYATVAGGFFVWIWVALSQERESWVGDQRISIWLLLCAVITIIGTLWQHLRGLSPSGLLPINPNFNAVWMAALAVFLTGETLVPGRLRAIKLGIALTLVFLVLIGFSRSALLGLLAGFAWLVVPLMRTRMKIYALLAVAIAIVFFLPWSLRRFNVTLEAHIYRPEIWLSALKASFDRPLTGYGLSNFETAYQRHPVAVADDPVVYGRTTSFAHNEFLQAATDIGWPFLVLIIAWIALLFRSNRRKPEQACLAVLAVGALFNPVWHMPILLFFALILAEEISSDVGIFAPTVSIPRFVFLLAGLFLVAITGWKSAASYLLQHGRINQVLAIDPWNADAWAMRGDMLNDERDCSDYRKAATLAPENVYYLEALGSCLEASQKQENIAPALNCYLNAIILSPRRATIPLAVGRLLFREGDPARALDWFRTAKHIEPCYWEADLWTARCIFMLGREKAAGNILAHLEREHALFVEHWPHYQPNSGYERQILAYDQHVIDRDRRKIGSSLY